ncbi:MAG: Smr/MutS family protein [Saprospiraceae bacterium]
MLFIKGSRIRFKYTGEEGTVVELLENDMINVELDDGEIIPAFQDDVIRIEDDVRSKHKPVVKAKSVQGKKPKLPPVPKRMNPESQYTILKSQGIQLAFEERKRLDGTTEKYIIHLINDTRYDVLYSFALVNEKSTTNTIHGKLEKLTAIAIDEMPFDLLNELPKVEMECWQITTEGTGNKLSKTIKIKAQQFFKRVTTAPILDIPVHHYIVFDKFDTDNKALKTEDLKSYTQRKVEEQPKKKSKNHITYNNYNTKAFAEFETELDLHVENLVGSTHGMTNADILQLQMKHFETYMKKAIRLGVPKVYIIHGLGKGRLKSDIGRWLEENPYVISFKNEYHHRYGYGATEVEL